MVLDAALEEGRGGGSGGEEERGGGGYICAKVQVVTMDYFEDYLRNIAVLV